MQTRQRKINRRIIGIAGALLLAGSCVFLSYKEAREDFARQEAEFMRFDSTYVPESRGLFREYELEKQGLNKQMIDEERAVRQKYLNGMRDGGFKLQRELWRIEEQLKSQQEQRSPDNTVYPLIPLF